MTKCNLGKDLLTQLYVMWYHSAGLTLLSAHTGPKPNEIGSPPALESQEMCSGSSFLSIFFVFLLRLSFDSHVFLSYRPLNLHFL